MHSMPEPVAPTNDEAKLALESSRRLASVKNQNLNIRVGGKNILLPAPAVKMLVSILSEMGQGNALTLTPIQAELTTQQAADLLSVSRPFLIQLLKRRKLPFKKVGTHRRILFSDVMAFKHKIDSKRLRTLKNLAAQAQELDMGY